MSLYIQEKYIRLISPKLDKFQWIGSGQDTATFRCPMCGDSEKSEYKTRGYFYKTKNDNYSYKCHNCGTGMGVYDFLMFKEPSLAGEFLKEIYMSKSRKTVYKPKVLNVCEPVRYEIEGLSRLVDNPFAMKYVKSRKIPESYYSKLFYTDNYQQWINDYISPKKFKNVYKTDKRLVIPFYDSESKPYAFQGRSLEEDSSLRYITINESKKTLIYGLEMVDFAKDVYILEGPIDSMYVDNSLAVAGSALMKLASYDRGNFVYVFDNQPRNKEIVKIIDRLLHNNSKARIVLLPDMIKEKDIGAMMENGLDKSELMSILKEYCYSGLMARHKFTLWRKI